MNIDSRNTKKNILRLRSVAEIFKNNLKLLIGFSKYLKLNLKSKSRSFAFNGYFDLTVILK